MSKAEIRKEVKSRVAKMTDIEKEWASNAIIDELISSKAFRSARNIFIYINMQDEPSTFDLIGLAMALEKVVCVPKLYSDGSMKPIIINPFTEFGVDEYGIQEPKKGKVAPYIDLAIVPMVAFDKECNRLGRGKGYYDRFFEQYDCKKIGIAFDCRLVEKVETEEHDVKMDVIVTEKRVLKDGLERHNKLSGEE